MDLEFRQQSVGETTYLVYDIEDSLGIDSFAMHMMAHNRMANIIQTQIVRINDRRQLQFQITGLMKLNSKIAVPRPKREVLGLLNSLLNAFEEVDAYMLDMERLLLDWEYIYVDGQGNCMLMYLPFSHPFGRDKISFLQEITGRIQPDYQEKDPYLYDISNAFSRGAVQKLSDFREIIKKSAVVVGETPVVPEPKEPIPKVPSPVAEAKTEIPSRVVPRLPKPTGPKPVAKPVSGQRVPVMNIPGREPGGGGIPKVPLPAPSGDGKNKDKGKEGKRHFWPLRKDKDRAGKDAREQGKSPVSGQEAARGYEKTSQEDMYESYLDTVIIPGPAFTPKGEEETMILTGQEAPRHIYARLVRRMDGTVYQIDRERTVVGSGAAATICISNNHAISRSHAEILWAAGEFAIIDNHSRNGSFINEKRLEPGVREPLYEGMRVRFANEDFDFYKE